MGEKETKEIKTDLDLEEMAKAGLHFGHRVSKVNPKMKPYIFGVRNDVHLIDLEKTQDKLNAALEFIGKLITEGKLLIVVGTKIQTRTLTEEFSKECGLPYISERWLGGTFTNFQTIKKRIDYLKDLEQKRTSGEFDKYTKKERLDIDKIIKRLEKKLAGIKQLTKLPEAIFVLDMKKDELAIREARAKGVTVIGISDTNVDPGVVDYPIPANDDALSSVKYILDKVKEVVKRAQAEIKPVEKE